MPVNNGPKIAWDEARALLGVGADADDASLRAAYLQKVRAHPPDRDPELFERIRDAYDQLRDPRLRARQALESPDPAAPLTSLIEETSPPRRFVGTEPWLKVLKEARS